MKDLRLVFKQTNGEEEDNCLSMERWIIDWCYDQVYIPQDESIILEEVEVANESIMQFLPEECTFGQLVDFLDWEEKKTTWNYYCEDSGTINTKENFEDWLRYIC